MKMNTSRLILFLSLYSFFSCTMNEEEVSKYQSNDVKIHFSELKSSKKDSIIEAQIEPTFNFGFQAIDINDDTMSGELSLVFEGIIFNKNKWKGIIPFNPRVLGGYSSGSFSLEKHVEYDFYFDENNTIITEIDLAFFLYESKDVFDFEETEYSLESMTYSFVEQRLEKAVKSFNDTLNFEHDIIITKGNPVLEHRRKITYSIDDDILIYQSKNYESTIDTGYLKSREIYTFDYYESGSMFDTLYLDINKFRIKYERVMTTIPLTV